MSHGHCVNDTEDGQMSRMGRGMQGFCMVVMVALLLVPCPLSPVPAPSVSAEGLKIGYVNLGKVFDGYQRTKASEQVLEQKGKQKQIELEARVAELKQLRQSLDLLSDQAKDVKVKELEEKSDELQRNKTRTERDFTRERNKLAKTILDEIGAAVNDYAKANGYALVLDQRSLLYGADVQNVTDDILKMLNDRYAAKAGKPSAKSN